MDNFIDTQIKVLIIIIVLAVIIGLPVGLIFGGGLVSNSYKETITREEINIDRENFEQSKSRLHGLADDLAKYKYELATEENEIARKAMIELIIDRTSSLNVDDLEDPSLREFVTSVKNGTYEWGHK